jgi:hypothetical protein
LAGRKPIPPGSGPPKTAAPARGGDNAHAIARTAAIAFERTRINNLSSTSPERRRRIAYHAPLAGSNAQASTIDGVARN